MDKLKAILKQVLKQTPNFESKMKDMEVLEAWPRAVGDRVAAHCWAVRVLDGGTTLLVAAESSAWLQNLRYLEVQILENLARELKAKRIKQLRFKLQTQADPT